MVAALIKLKPDLSNHVLRMSQKEELTAFLLKLCQTSKFARSIVPLVIQSCNRKYLDLLQISPISLISIDIQMDLALESYCYFLQSD